VVGEDEAVPTPLDCVGAVVDGPDADAVSVFTRMAWVLRTSVSVTVAAAEPPAPMRKALQVATAPAVAPWANVQASDAVNDTVPEATAPTSKMLLGPSTYVTNIPSVSYHVHSSR
jgi:hypothetical protein